MYEYAWLIIIAPLVGFLLSILLGKKVWEGGAPFTIGSIAFSLAVSLYLLVDVFTTGGLGAVGEEVIAFEWIGGIEIGLLIDNLSVLLLALVSFLCLLIAIYSVGYMHKEEGKPRYYAEIALFTAGMLGTVSAHNFLQMLIFWEIMGLCSYLLIGFWYTKPEAASAAKKAFLVTRIGDVLFLIGVIVLFIVTGTFNILDIQGATLPAHLITIVPLLLFGGAVGKSAQFPLHVWLPDAMEGPTTVSALIHAATMVKAGVFLTARSFFLIKESPEAILVVGVIGGFTAFYAATMALVANDIKRVLAYSTISQIGYMMLGLGAGAYLVHQGHEALGYTFAIFHLMNHAFFKALLFLGSGSVIHAVGTNDMRLMGGLRKKMRITSMTMLIGAISIAGIPPFSGFWSKDGILEVAFEAGGTNTIFLLIWVLGIMTVFMTAFYMFRMWFMTFAGEKRSPGEVHESPKSMTIPLMILAFFALFSGVLTFATGGGFGQFIFFEAGHGSVLAELVHVFSNPLTYLSIGMAFSGILFAYVVYYRQAVSSDVFTSSRATKGIHKLLVNRYYMDYAYNMFGLKIAWGFAKVCDWFDRKAIDGFVNGVSKGGILFSKANDWFDRKGVDGLVDGVSNNIVGAGRRLRKSQTGNIQGYLAAVVLGICFIIALTWILVTINGG
ncbi:MAG: NADH-quinone oxidoreductase subunit L [Methanomassiliicoccales archaeon]|nr:MAG: NADH-quinone oxidoreductase subunit L [Methanomassiliicoccales archaeon]